MPRSETRLFPALLRHWRTLRGLSQLDLALAADVSARHVSFLETGRAQPSREMALRLATTLSVPLREQNDLLRAAGFPDAFAEPGLEGGLPPGVAQAIDRMLAKQEPFPLTVLDRHYNVLRTNEGAARLLARFIADPSALGAPPNAFAALFDPRLGRPFVVDWERVAHALVSRLHLETLARPADALRPSGA
jgi:transcriptional regulator with XRE-family HTH domain